MLYALSLMERQKDGTYIKKGPWTAEEDEVLRNYVEQNGPRDWSSVRSKGLLPRTGKSCRLRWVNKLRPNLKTYNGCKFTAEEERMVIELQAQFGNKWAKIASYLTGRSDNDVKNFWSCRRKRLERILQANSQKGKRKTNAGIQGLHDQYLNTLEVPNCSSTPMDELESTWKDQSHHSFYIGNYEMLKMIPIQDCLVNPNFLNSEPNNQPFEISHTNITASIESSSSYPFSQLPQPHLDLPVLSECPEMPSDPGRNSLDSFEQGEPSETKSCKYIKLEDTAEKGQGIEIGKPTVWNDLFDDFPTDMFDYFDLPPSS